MSIKSPLANGKRKAWLVREKAGERLPEVANGLGLGLLLAVASGARDPAEERGVAEGVEGIGQRLGFTGKGTEKHRKEKRGSEELWNVYVNIREGKLREKDDGSL